MKKFSILLCALFLTALSALADGFETLCFKGKMGGHVAFRAAGKNKVAFEICNAPSNIAEGKSAPGRPALLEEGYFKYDNVNECGYGFECQIYDKYLVITSTTDPKTFDCFGAFTTFEGVYIKVEE